MFKNPGSWLVFSLINLVIVAVYGVTMRYKIGFEFPLFDQKNLLHAHSHFAFAGWITQTLMVLMVMSIFDSLNEKKRNLFRTIFLTNLLSAYGMLIAFTLQGYGSVAITFSSISILIYFVFVWSFAIEIKKNRIALPGKYWFAAALVFGVLSTLGTFALVYMMVTKNLHQDWYLASLYYYLHFQYNGWFLFACLGLLWNKLSEFIPGFDKEVSIFWMFALACFPAYFLSALWMKFPGWMYWVIVLAAFVQVLAWGKLIWLIKKNYHQLKNSITNFSKYLFLFVTITMSIKLLLQLFSTIPVMSKLAFGFRPIVIAYLHLILLAVISVFLLTWLYHFRFIIVNKFTTIAIGTFTIGVFLNEFALMIQGIASFSYFPVPNINESLFVISLLLLIGAALLLGSQFAKAEKEI